MVKIRSMDQPSLESTLADLKIPAIRFFTHIGSTNDEALRWVEAGAPDRALVVADAQTAGRGRLNRRWITTPGTGLAFSLILLSPPLDTLLISRLTGLGALAVCNALEHTYSLSAHIKWPNDVLLNGCKVAGILTEAQWSGDTLSAVVLGIGINIAPRSISQAHLPGTALSFPVTCVENAVGHGVDRLEFLYAILYGLFSWLPRLALPDFIYEWEARLAFRDQWVEISPGVSGERLVPSTQDADISVDGEVGKLMGLTPQGYLKFLTKSGNLVTISVGEIHLRPATDCHSSS